MAVVLHACCPPPSACTKLSTLEVIENEQSPLTTRVAAMIRAMGNWAACWTRGAELLPMIVEAMYVAIYHRHAVATKNMSLGCATRLTGSCTVRCTIAGNTARPARQLVVHVAAHKFIRAGQRDKLGKLWYTFVFSCLCSWLCCWSWL